MRGGIITQRKNIIFYIAFIKKIIGDVKDELALA